jgi:uncharacterized protein GlcG (DUF336 family)
MKKSLLILVSVFALYGCNATMSDLKQKAAENPLLAVAAGFGAGALVLATGGVALIGPAVAGAGVYGVSQYEDGLKSEVDKMSCKDAKKLADMNYYGANQRNELLGRACAQKKVSQK